MPLLNIVLTNRTAGSGGECGCPLEFGSVMGQEDLYRKELGVRVDNAGTARIVWATSAPANSRVIYSANNEDLDLDTGVVATDNTFHEVFIEGLNVDTLYAFQVISESTVCNETIQSETYFFQIGGEVTQTATNLDIEILFEFPNAPVTAALVDEITISFDTTSIEGTGLLEMEVPVVAAEAIDATEGDELGASELFTTYSTGVV